MADPQPTNPENRYLVLAGTARRVVTRRVEDEDRHEIDKRLHPVLGKVRQLKRLKAIFAKMIGKKITDAETALERLDAAWHGKERPVLTTCRIEIDARGLGQVRVVDDETNRVVDERALTSKEREAHFQGNLWEDDGKPVIAELKDQNRPDDALAAADKVLNEELTAADLRKLIEEAEKDPSRDDDEEEDDEPKPVREKKPRASKKAAAPAPAPAPAEPPSAPAAAAPTPVRAAPPAAPVAAAPAPPAAPEPEPVPPMQQVFEAAKRAGEMGIGLIVGDLSADDVREAAAAHVERGAFRQVAEDRWVYIPRVEETPASFRLTLADTSELLQSLVAGPPAQVAPAALPWERLDVSARAALGLHVFELFGVNTSIPMPAAADPAGRVTTELLDVGYKVLGLAGDRVRVHSEPGREEDGPGEEAMIPLADFAEQVRGGRLVFTAASTGTPEAPAARALERDPEPAPEPGPAPEAEPGNQSAYPEQPDVDVPPAPPPPAAEETPAIDAAPVPPAAPAPPPPAAPALAADLRAETKAELLEMMRERSAEGLALGDAVAVFAERSGTKADKLPAVLADALPDLLRELAGEGALGSEEPGADVKDARGPLFWLAGTDKPAYPKKKKGARGPR